MGGARLKLAADGGAEVGVFGDKQDRLGLEIGLGPEVVVGGAAGFEIEVGGVGDLGVEEHGGEGLVAGAEDQRVGGELAEVILQLGGEFGPAEEVFRRVKFSFERKEAEATEGVGVHEHDAEDGVEDEGDKGEVFEPLFGCLGEPDGEEDEQRDGAEQGPVGLDFAGKIHGGEEDKNGQGEADKQQQSGGLKDGAAEAEHGDEGKDKSDGAEDEGLGAEEVY